uniref:Chemokine interleukin-8-like domain-containing protein n=1 Tax=Pundamilia nyererei TaxID=303518 RepID=A0A3B4F2T9_9CICH
MKTAHETLTDFPNACSYLLRLCSAHLFLYISIMFSGTFGPEKCCFQFLRVRFPAKRVTSFEYTDKRCAMEGVLKTVGDKQLCADPTMQWVKKIIESIQSKNDITPGHLVPGRES